MSRGPGRPAKPIPSEVLERIERHLDEGWPFQEITRTYGVGYYALRRMYPGRQWTNRDAARHGVLVRTMKVESTARTVPGREVRVVQH